MPDDPAPLIRLPVLPEGLTLGQTPDRFLHRPELLVTGHHLDPPRPRLREKSEVADQVQEMLFSEHSCHQSLLTRQPLHPQLLCHLGLRDGTGVLPFQIVLRQGPHGPDSGFLPKSGHHKLIVVKEAFRPFVPLHPVPLVGIREELFHRRLHRFIDVGAFALHHRQGNPVDKQDQIRNDRPPAPRRIHPELVDHQKLVVVRVFIIDEVEGLILPPVKIRISLHLHPLQQQLQRPLVGLQQLVGTQPVQGAEGLVHPGLIQPVPALLPVDPAQGRFHPPLQQHLPEV